MLSWKFIGFKRKYDIYSTSTYCNIIQGLEVKFLIDTNIFVRTIDRLDVALCELPKGFASKGTLEIGERDMGIALEINRVKSREYIEGVSLLQTVWKLRKYQKTIAFNMPIDSPTNWTEIETSLEQPYSTLCSERY